MVAVASYGVEVFRASGLFLTVGKMVTFMLFMLYYSFKNINRKVEPGDDSVCEVLVVQTPKLYPLNPCKRAGYSIKEL